MKKLFPLLLAVVLMTACDINDVPVTLTASSTINEAISVSIPQTNGTSVAYDQTLTQDLNDLITNFDDVTDITINSLSYQYQNVTGNTDAVISATIVINGNTVSSSTDVNIAQEANNGTVFSITDQAVIDQLESLLLSNPTLNIQFAGTAISDAGSVDFEIQLNIGLTVTLN